MLSDAKETLESEIVDYAMDYDRAEYARSTRWPQVETALTAFEAAVRADQIEKDAALNEGIMHPDSKPCGVCDLAAAIRAQLTESGSPDVDA